MMMMMEVASRRSTTRPPLFPLDDDRIAAPLSRKLVLVVDDYEDARALYAANLEEAGFNVVEASDGAEAVHVATSQPVDAIIMDLSMPRVDGWDATRQIRAAIGERPVYIIALSALDGDASRALAFDAGCDDFIAKPFLPAGLVAVLRAHFEK